MERKGLRAGLIKPPSKLPQAIHTYPYKTYKWFFIVERQQEGLLASTPFLPKKAFRRIYVIYVDFLS